MDARIVWTWLESPLEPDTAGSGASAGFAMRLERLASAGNTTEILDQIVTEWESSEGEPPPSIRQQCCFWFVLGRERARLSDWDRALAAFERCEKLLPFGDRLAAVHCLLAMALAAQQAHQDTRAERCYEQLITLWESLTAPEQTAYLAEDGQAFRCNLYRLQADVWRKLAACGTARNRLENYVLPLVEAAFSMQPTPHYYPAASQNEQNWRLLRLFVPWEFSVVLNWQARLASDPSEFESDLFRATIMVAEAAHLSEILEEGKQWTASLYTAAAEVQIQRCRLSHNRVLQTAICQAARTYLSRAGRAQLPVGASQSAPLHELVLSLPVLELRICELLALDATRLADGRQRLAAVLEEVQTCYERSQADPDPGFQLFAARCAWLMGSCDAQLILHDPRVYERAHFWYDQALALLPKTPGFTTLYERAIQADIARLDNVN